MDLLKRANLRSLWVTARAVAPGLFLLGSMMSCGRDYATPWLPTAPRDSIHVVGNLIPKDSTHVIKPPDPVLITGVSAPDMRLAIGETKLAAVNLDPVNATSPVYEMTSSKPVVAEVRPEGIHANLPGTATITVHTLDGSEKIARFKVTVDPNLVVCLGNCGCGEGGKGKDKDCGG